MDYVFQMVFGFVFSVLFLLSLFMLLYHAFIRWSKPKIGFMGLFYDKESKLLELFVVNDGEKPVHVSPSLRLVHFLNPEEWREKNSNGKADMEHMMEGKCYQVDSVIKGYTLLGDCDAPVAVDGRSIRKITYPLGDELDLNVYDNIRVDSKYGFNTVLNERLFNTMRVVFKDHVDAAVLECPAPETLKEPYNPKVCLITPSGGIREPKVENCFPVQALCVCCGKSKFLEWVVDGNYVCNECKDFLKGEKNDVSMLPEEEAELSIGDSTVEKHSTKVDLNPRQGGILQLFEHENNLTVKKISSMLSVNQSTVSSDLKSLMDNELLGRVKAGRKYLYHLA